VSSDEAMSPLFDRMAGAIAAAVSMRERAAPEALANDAAAAIAFFLPLALSSSANIDVEVISRVSVRIPIIVTANTVIIVVSAATTVVA